jgi:hypothetical protein
MDEASTLAYREPPPFLATSLRAPSFSRAASPAAASAAPAAAPRPRASTVSLLRGWNRSAEQPGEQEAAFLSY